MDNGFIKLHRSIEQNELLMNDNTAFVVFTRLLLLVDWRTGKFVTGRNKLAVQFNLNPATLYSALKRLESSSMLQLHSNSSSTTIYICNWHKYQQRINSSSSDGHQSVNTIQEEEKEEDIDTKVSITKAVQPSRKQISHDIDEVFAEWPKIMGYEIISQIQKNRNAASNLVKKFGVAVVKQHITVAHMANLDQYSKIRTSDFVELQSNLNKLAQWVRDYKRKTTAKPNKRGANIG